MPLSTWRLFGEGLRTSICWTVKVHILDALMSFLFRPRRTCILLPLQDISHWWQHKPFTAAFVCQKSFLIIWGHTSTGEKNPTITQGNLIKMLVYNLLQWKQSCHSGYANDPHSAHCVRYWILCRSLCTLQTQVCPHMPVHHVPGSCDVWTHPLVTLGLRWNSKHSLAWESTYDLIFFRLHDHLLVA